MLPRLLRRSLLVRGKRAAPIVFTLALGSALTTVLFTLALRSSDRIARELRAFGANVVLVPREAAGAGEERAAGARRYVEEASLGKVRTIFWRHNIVAFAPLLSGLVHVDTNAGETPVIVTGTWFRRRLQVGDGGEFVTGAEEIFRQWRLEGEWPSSGEVLVGSEIARAIGLRVGQTVRIRHRDIRRDLAVVGVFESGGEEEGQLFADLGTVQEILRLPGRVDRVLVSALTKADDALARRDPAGMPPALFETWYCSPYLASILYQLEEAIPEADAQPIGRIVEAEQAVFRRIQLLFGGMTAVGFLAVVLAVVTTVSAEVAERSDEIALLKALGASRAQIARLFLTEQGILGLTGGVLGCAAAALFFVVQAADLPADERLFHPGAIPLGFAAGIVLAVAGAAHPVWTAAAADAAPLLQRER